MVDQSDMSDEEIIEILTGLFDDVQQLQKEEIAKQQKQDEETIKVLGELLPKVGAIRAKYTKLEEIQGTHFNVFSVLREESDEVHLHSKFICYLLDPRAEHRQGAGFLRHFLQTEGFNGFFTEEEIANASVERERFYIDILISSGSKAVIIENKIWADYGDNQLGRYQQKLIDQGYTKENIKLVYLNLQGDAVPENEQDETVREETIVLSYKEHIIGWLQKCLASVVLVPTIRETLVQYINLTRKLVGKSLNAEETMEMKELFLKDPKRIQAFANAQEAFEQAKEELDNKIFDGLKEKFKVHKYNFGHVIYGEHKSRRGISYRHFFGNWYFCHICNVKKICT